MESKIINSELLIKEMEGLEKYLESRNLSNNDINLILKRTIELITFNYTREGIRG